MSLILVLETATPVCSVALARNGELLSLSESTAPNAHAGVITSFIENLFREAALSYSDLDAVAVSKGPGSYTGLRIGVATAKGLCYALDKPLLAIPTLEAMASGMLRDEGRGAKDEGRGTKAAVGLLYCPMIDARRMEVYCALYDEHLREVRPTEAVIVNEHSFEELQNNQPILFAGNGAAKCKETLSGSPNALFLDHFRPSARFLTGLAEERFRKTQFEDLAYFEPFYLKDFIAGIPKVKGLK